MPDRRPTNAAQSTYLWRESMPTKLQPVEHHLKAKVTDMLGRTFTQKGSYSIEAPKTVQ